MHQHQSSCHILKHIRANFNHCSRNIFDSTLFICNNMLLFFYEFFSSAEQEERYLFGTGFDIFSLNKLLRFKHVTLCLLFLFIIVTLVT